MAAASSGALPLSIQWSKSLKILPKFTSEHINLHLNGCGKKTIGEKGYKFFVENYIHDVFVGQTEPNSDNVFVKGRCFRSQRKNEEPHSLYLEAKNTGEITRTQCSCKAGSGGHCNHIFALLYLLIHWTLLGVAEIAADKTCTSLPQQWHKPRTKTIEADPIMKCTFAQACKDRDGERKRKPVQCKLYNAAKKVKIRNQDIMDICDSMSKESKVPPFSYLLSDQENVQNINTVIGNVPLGTYLGYQLQDQKKKKSAFYATRGNNVLLPDMQPIRIEPFPDLPLVPDGASFDSTAFPNNPTTKPILEKITVTPVEAKRIHHGTVQQSLSPEWHRQRKFRLTASNFGRVLIRKRLPSDSFMNGIFQTKDLSHVQSINHGKQNESLARTIYSQKMQKKVHRLFSVYESGLVVNPMHPFLAATPDGKVFDPTEENCFGLVEIKCPYTWRNMTLLEACQDDKFHCHMVDGEIHLKQEHSNGYYAQVQGQLALSRLSWCDFIIFLTGSRNMSVERVYFNSRYWEETLFPKMRDFYIQHCLNYFAHQMSV